MTATVPELAPGRWRVDAGRSSVTFAGKHLLGAITGVVPDVSGWLLVDEEPARSRVDITIGLGSADFGSAFWNDVVRTHDMLGTRTHPTARYASTSVNWQDDTGKVEGVLQLHGRAASVPLQVRAAQPGRPGARSRSFTASTSIDRRDFGLRWDLAVVGGDRLVARQVRFDIALTAVRSS